MFVERRRRPRQPRVGLLGGSFNPPHLGHLALARVARDHLRLDELLWVPAGQPWQKAGQFLAPAADRAAMVSAMIAGEPRMQLDERELHRQGPSYTLDTVLELQAERPGAELFLVIGQDQYAGLHTWRQPAALLAAVTLAVAARDGQAPQASPLLAALPHRPETLPLPRTDVSASTIRAALAAGQPVDRMVGEPVARYIDQHLLYRVSPGH